MAHCRLLVEKGSTRDPTQDWGLFDFVSVPSPADRVAVEHEGQLHYLTVLCAHHRPVRPGEGEPSAEIVARWTGCEA